MNPQPNGAETVDHDEVARFSRLAGSGGTRTGRWRLCTNSIRSGWLTSAIARPSISAAIRSEPRQPRGLAFPRYRMRWRHPVRAVGPARRRGGRGRSVGREHCGGAGARRAVGLAIDYRDTTAEALAAAGERFDVVLAMEVVEHVTDVGVFIAHAAAMVKPGGLLFVATLNRTAKSFALAIVGAEYILRWVPRGTHRWDKFVTPHELEIAIETERAAHHRRKRRHLQSDRRPLAALARHGRQLHGGRGEAGA